MKVLDLSKPVGFSDKQGLLSTIDDRHIVKKS